MKSFEHAVPWGLRLVCGWYVPNCKVQTQSARKQLSSALAPEMIVMACPRVGYTHPCTPGVSQLHHLMMFTIKRLFLFGAQKVSAPSSRMVLGMTWGEIPNWWSLYDSHLDAAIVFGVYAFLGEKFKYPQNHAKPADVRNLFRGVLTLESPILSLLTHVYHSLP